MNPDPEFTETEQVAALEKRLADLRAVVREHEDKIRIYHAYNPDDEARVLRAILAHYHDVATRHIAAARQFRDDTAVQLRALSLVVEMVGGAHTHAEKAARLRGMAELLESAVAKLRDARFDIQETHWRFPDVFRNDYPVRSIMDEVRRLTDENEELRRQLRQMDAIITGSPDTGGDARQDEPGDPFAETERGRS